jgi:hypothetical protein
LLGNTIELRPREIGARKSFGHWDDLIAFRQDLARANLTSLVDRQSRYTILARNRDRNAIGVVTGLMNKLKAGPPQPGNWARSRAVGCSRAARDGEPLLQSQGTLAKRPG